MESHYHHILDLFPQEKPEFNKLHGFYDNLRDGRFTTSRCNDCGSRHWPPRTVCPECLSSKLSWVDLPKEGIIIACTTYALPLPGFSSPHSIGLIQVDPELRILGRILHSPEQTPAIDDRVEFTVIEVPRDRVMYAYKLT